MLLERRRNRSIVHVNLPLSAQSTRGMTPGMPVLIYPRSRNDLSQFFQTNVR